MQYSAIKQGERVAFLNDMTIGLIQPSDLVDIITMLDDEAVTEYLFFAPAPIEVYEGYFNPIIEDTKEALDAERWPSNPTFVVRDNQNKFLGMAGIAGVALLAGNFEVGYQLPQASWGKGLGTALCQFATQLVFEHLNGHKVAADCYASNVGSYRVMEKVGYVKEGTQVGYYLRNDKLEDRVIYGMTLAQFRALNA
ncbi:GNAT family N-acetyltransferase [Thaumasiovibrio subtropicus]|uniref:GNAT family N-acetyltransferase n=1 Tax=Thaumasiovibrio subtropicus TaxID=1891207 RepID=UPI000B35D600|nr:GNAT family protein [Thaumasiovibrio subtropicus]